MAKAKPWQQSHRRRRPSGSQPRRKLLIFSEDEKSSSLYFRAFPVDRERYVLEVVGTGRNTLSLVQYAVRRVGEMAQEGVVASDVWCVFDRDDFPAEHFNQAFELALRNGFKVAWSNEAFELWYLLHFDYIDSAISRDSYAGRLGQHGVLYQKNDATIYGQLLEHQKTALQNAAKLENYWKSMRVSNPERENPSTGVHKLVQALNALAASVKPEPG